jgi:hypothetical protein
MRHVIDHVTVITHSTRGTESMEISFVHRKEKGIVTKVQPMQPP